MEKKALKFYEAPQVEIVEMEVEGHLLAGSGDDVNTGAGEAGGWE